MKLEASDLSGPLLLEQTCHLAEQGYDGLEVAESLVDSSNDGVVKVLISNPSGATQKMKRGTWIGVASEAEPVECVTNKANFQPRVAVRSATPIKEPQDNILPTVCSVQTTHEETRKQKLVESVAEIEDNLPCLY